jgi:hypothetical protein
MRNQLKLVLYEIENRTHLLLKFLIEMSGCWCVQDCLTGFREGNYVQANVLITVQELLKVSILSEVSENAISIDDL